MSLVIREMALDEVGLAIDYFHGSTPEHLETLGVDPTRLPTRQDWRAWYAAEYDKPVQDRSTLLVIWELDGVAIGFSTADKIVYGEQAHMHLHIVDPQRRRSGIGSACVRETAELYFNAPNDADTSTSSHVSNRGHALADVIENRPKGASAWPSADARFSREGSGPGYFTARCPRAVWHQHPDDLRDVWPHDPPPRGGVARGARRPVPNG
jgi:ribosomal protein S18 acetylase RimI-like enzyme